jgi:hypothetical protein
MAEGFNSVIVMGVKDSEHYPYTPPLVSKRITIKIK